MSLINLNREKLRIGILQIKNWPVHSFIKITLDSHNDALQNHNNLCSLFTNYVGSLGSFIPTIGSKTFPILDLDIQPNPAYDSKYESELESLMFLKIYVFLCYHR